MRVGLMIEGQEGVTWEQWVALARACEDHGLDGLFRSDHHVSISAPGEHGALEAWSTLAALGPMTSRIRLGVLVSPVTFRHPSMLARMVVTADHTSNGRVELGMGAGWYEREHEEYGFPYPDNRTRMDMLEEQLRIVHGQMREEAFDFDGAHYRLRRLRAHPAPVQRPHPPLIVGGTAGPRSVAMAARFADEYNTLYVGPKECRARRSRLQEACEREGRDPSTIRFSLMTTCIVGRDRDDLTMRVRRAGGDDPDAFADSHPGWLVGTAAQMVEHLGELEAAGVERVMLQQHAHEDLDMVAAIGGEIVPNV